MWIVCLQCNYTMLHHLSPEKYYRLQWGHGFVILTVNVKDNIKIIIAYEIKEKHRQKCISWSVFITKKDLYNFVHLDIL